MRVINKFADDETNSRLKTVLLMKIGGGNHGIGIHGTHLGPESAFATRPPTNSARTSVGSTTARAADHTTADAKPNSSASREMDCMDRHNCPAHSYDLPDRHR